MLCGRRSPRGVWLGSSQDQTLSSPSRGRTSTCRTKTCCAANYTNGDSLFPCFPRCSLPTSSCGIVGTAFIAPTFAPPVPGGAARSTCAGIPVLHLREVSWILLGIRKPPAQEYVGGVLTSGASRGSYEVLPGFRSAPGGRVALHLSVVVTPRRYMRERVGAADTEMMTSYSQVVAVISTGTGAFTLSGNACAARNRTGTIGLVGPPVPFSAPPGLVYRGGYSVERRCGPAGLGVHSHMVSVRLARSFPRSRNRPTITRADGLSIQKTDLVFHNRCKTMKSQFKSSRDSFK